jgi:hypothetical protein
MDTNAILLIIGLLILLWVASRFFNRGGPTAPTYDDKNIRSGGSIGGGAGQPSQRTHDDPNIESGGSFGGSNARSNTPSSSSSSSANVGNRSPKPQAAPPKRGGNDDPNTRSGGSFGG